MIRRVSLVEVLAATGIAAPASAQAGQGSLLHATLIKRF
jgi:hypothetical protein